VVGPKDLPRLARTIGKWAAKGRSLAYEFQRSLDAMAREAELDDIKKDLKELDKVTKTDLRKTIRETIDPDGSLAEAVKPPRLDLPTGPGAVKPTSPPPAPVDAPTVGSGDTLQGPPAAPHLAAADPAPPAGAERG
jgi:sec-independent protein translocase protein TatB